MNETTQNPSLEVDVDRDHCVLTGNRAGLELLRRALERILNSDEKSVLLDDGRLDLELVVLDEELPAPAAVLGWKERLAIFLYLTGFLVVLSSTVLGFYHLLNFLSN